DRAGRPEAATSATRSGPPGPSPVRPLEPPRPQGPRLRTPTPAPRPCSLVGTVVRRPQAEPRPHWLLPLLPALPPLHPAHPLGSSREEEGNGCWASATESSGRLILLSQTFLVLLLNVGFTTEDGATEISQCWIVSHKAPLSVPQLGSQLPLLIQLDTLA
ncbi:hypothetical protein MC885_021565, partial [Smutsia gigantea]